MSSNKCACGGYFNDWHSHASDCVEINSKGGKDYNDFSNVKIARDIRELCEDIKKELYDSGICDYDEAQNVLEWTRIIKSMTHYIKDNQSQIVAFERCDDGELFTLNDDGVTYSMQKSKLQFPDSLHTRNTAQELIDTDFFKPIIK